MVTSEEEFKHLTDDSRMKIQNGLNIGCTFKQIARRIGKDPTTVSKEVKKHMRYGRQKMRRALPHLVNCF